MKTQLLAAILCSMVLARASTVVWTNTQGGNWNLAANWNPNVVPGMDDTACITNGGTYTVTLNVNAAIRGLVLGGENGTQTLALKSSTRTLTIQGVGTVNPRGQLDLVPGNLASAGQLTVLGALNWAGGSISNQVIVGSTGAGSWTAGTLASGARLTVEAGSALTLSGGTAKNIDGTLINAGQVTWTGTQGINLTGEIHNMNGAVFEAQSDESFPYRPTGRFVNDGVFRKSGGTGTTEINVGFVNDGIVDTQTGTIDFAGSPEKIFNSGCQFTGSGTNKLSSSQITINGRVISENLLLNDALAKVDGTGTVEGSFAWYSGTLSSNVSFQVPVQGLVVLASKTSKYLNGFITNAGTVQWTGTGNLNVGGTIHNLPGGMFEIANDESLYSLLGAPVFVNEGTVRKSSPGATRVFIPMVNRGVLDLGTGTLDVTGGYAQEGGMLTLAGGTLQRSTTLAFDQGAVLGFGFLKAQRVESSATIRPSAIGGPLTVEGDFTQRPGGALEVELGGTSPGVNQSRLDVKGTATLSSALRVTLAPGYVPDVGDSYVILTCQAPCTGQYQCLSGTYLLGYNRRLEVVYSPTGVSLLTVAGPDPTLADLQIRILGLPGEVMLCWPEEFAEFLMQYTLALSPPDWHPQAITAPGRLISPATNSESYYRLFKP